MILPTKLKLREVRGSAKASQPGTGRAGAFRCHALSMPGLHKHSHTSFLLSPQGCFYSKSLMTLTGKPEGFWFLFCFHLKTNQEINWGKREHTVTNGPLITEDQEHRVLARRNHCVSSQSRNGKTNTGSQGSYPWDLGPSNWKGVSQSSPLEPPPPIPWPLTLKCLVPLLLLSDSHKSDKQECASCIAYFIEILGCSEKLYVCNLVFISAISTHDCGVL